MQKAFNLPSILCVRVQNNIIDEDPLFVDAAGMDFQLRVDSPAYELGFKKIPIYKIGLFADDFRPVLPAEPAE